MAKRANNMARYSRGSNGLTAERTETMLEAENDRQVDALHSKVAMLKDLTIDIGEEVRSQNSMLSDMGGSFDDAGSLLGISMRKVGNLANSTNGRMLCYLVGFAVTVFCVIWYLMK
ncbi:uncharacterized protein MONBRDRAFT_24896 [Monosiga brevicollis MX1]|uniref:t-SNARE coiled-coil homology domain-containing protein n=1 Tax=Monosiga brevicollis TaxID=81824 RepID=A9UY27_MONBE|nr:uncharacterized protein MONBRDRAFT_24896 [Monosiga brevicollis MX1]EDQ89789.1 predicted protein [Monosiga brevicollis MX1]|eukprot:XP_001745211.1 hypothetical protein [Monosiga brevicollis MX1]